MGYILSFDIAAIILSIVILLLHRSYYIKNESSKKFALYVWIACLAAFLDIVTALIIDRRFILPDFISSVLNSVYLLSAFFACYAGFLVLSNDIGYNNKIAINFNKIIAIVTCILMTINLFTGWQFSFVDGEYIRGKLFLLNIIMPEIIAMHIIVAITVERKKLTFQKMFIAASFVFVPMAASLIQIFAPRVLITAFATVLPAVLFSIAFETPTHEHLAEVMKELEISKQNEEESRLNAEKANREKTEFLEKMSHELRTPVNAVLGFSEMINIESKEVAVTDRTTIIKESGVALLNLIGDFMDYSQIENDNMRYNPVEYATVRLYLGAYNCFNDRLSAKLEYVNLDPELPQILYGDVNRFRQIMTNLAKYSSTVSDNALISLDIHKHSIERNYVDMDIIIKLKNLNVSFEQLNKQFTMSFDQAVADSDSEHLKESMLLPVTKKFIDSICDNSEVLSVEEGNIVLSFILRQQIIDLMEMGEISNAIETYKRLSKDLAVDLFVAPEIRVLAVDDMPVNLKVFAGIIKTFKIEPDLATSGPEAIELMKKKSYDIVFMDHMMPGMDGVETLHNIKTEDDIISKNAIFAVLTANISVGAEEMYKAEGFDIYMSKPVNTENIGIILRQYFPDKIVEEFEELDASNVEEENVHETVEEVMETKSVDSEPVEEITDNSFASDEGDPVTFDDIPGLDVQLGLSMCMGDMSLYRDILTEFGQEDVTINLCKFFDEEDWDNYRILIHGVKNTANTIGHAELSEKAKALEFACRENNIDFVRENHMDWVEQYRTIYSLIRRLK